jgi:DNA-binding XRE family transcriptional regulator
LQVAGRELPLPSNNVQTFREGLMMSKAELARKAGLSTLTIDRVEAGRPCRLDTKRKILLALDLKVSDKDRLFGVADPDVSTTSPSQYLETPARPAMVWGGVSPGKGERTQ